MTAIWFMIKEVRGSLIIGLARTGVIADNVALNVFAARDQTRRRRRPGIRPDGRNWSVAYGRNRFRIFLRLHVHDRCRVRLGVFSMQRLSGALMVLAGVGLGGYSMLPASDDPAATLAEVTRIWAAPDRDPRMAAPSTLPAAIAPSTTDSRDAPSGSVRVFSPSTPLHPAETNTLSGTTTTWTAVVTADRVAGSKFTSPKPGDADARSHLASDLQRELKRVGCYGGEITGAWTQSTKRAMSDFMERVNATLPVEEPDYILLTLVQGHAALACGADCPAGEMRSDTGRCLPSAVVAQANRKAQRSEERLAERRMAEQRKAEQQERLAQEQRTTEAKRIAAAQRSEAQRLAAAANAKFAEIEADSISRAAKAVTPAARPVQKVAGNSEVLPWLKDAQGGNVPARTVQTVERSEPLPGMMSVGGPRIATAVVPPTSADLNSTNRVSRPSPSSDGIGGDDLNAASSDAIIPPAPRPAVRPDTPIREAALQAGLPGTKAGPDERVIEVYGQADPALRKYAPAKIVRRPSYDGGPKLKAKYYAYNSGGKTRRGQPRPGTPRYNLLQSLGGIY